MMLSPFLMLILSIILYNIFSEVNSAGVPNASLLTNSTPLDTNNLEFISNFDYKFETLAQIITKMDNSLKNLQEKSHNWAIFQHNINSWNEGIRVFENKLDLLKRTHEEQNQQNMQKLEFMITDNSKTVELLLKDVKQTIISDRGNINEISSKINDVLKHIQLASVGCNGRKPSKNANIMALLPQQCLCANITNKLEQRLNAFSHQMALQKDLKQLNSLEKRNSKSLENINKALSNQMDKYDEITTRLQKSNECCYSLSSELTTFTESSDILLKRLEKLVRSVSERLNNIEVTAKGSEHSDDIEDIDNENQESENEETFSNKDTDEDSEQGELEQEKSKSIVDVFDMDGSVPERFEHDDGLDVEFVSPMLSGCHELLNERTDLVDECPRIDGIYKFSNSNINHDDRDFNVRYCVFDNSPNDTGLPWTVIQRRGPYKQQEHFNRSWSEYRNGFGHLSRDFWFGNEFIYRLVYHDDYELRIELEDFDGVQKWAEYTIFRIDSEKYNYNLLIGGHRGTLEDAMKYHNDNDFSTYDKRNDKTVDACCSCAMGYASGWWFDNCSEANLNGIYHYTPLGHNYNGIMWELWHGDYSLKKARMMIRPRRSLHKDVVHSQDYHEYSEDP